MTMSAVTNDALKSGDDHDAAKNGNDGDANGMRRVTIQQVQLEQDTAKTGTASGHRIGNQTNDAVTSHDINNNDMHSVDLNRAGMPLLEIVTDPDFRSGAEAAAFVRKVQGILRALHASQANMDEVEWRIFVCDHHCSDARSNNAVAHCRAPYALM